MQDFFRSETLSMGALTVPVAKNSAAFAKADPVTIDGDGWLIVATAGTKVMGYAMEDFTAASDNQTVAKKTPLCCPARGQLMVYTSDQACTQTDVGAYANLAGTTGAITIDLAAGSAGQFIVRGFDPDKDGSTTKVVVMAAEVQDDAYAQV
jgi:hypothetical protein